MKKRTMVLGGLIAAVAITGYSVSGTYARYISQVGVEDKARVAQWFLDEENTATLFGEMYGADGKITETEADAVVKSTITNDITNVIAPGTKGEYAFKLSGTSEVNYELSSVITANNTVKYNVTDATDIGNLTGTGLLETGNVYSPLKFKLYKGEDSTSGTQVTIATAVNGRTDTLEAVVKYLEDEVYGKTGATKTFSAGSAALDAYTITWEWEFNNPTSETDPANTISKYDTKIAQTAVNTPAALTVSLKADITAKQINTVVAP